MPKKDNRLIIYEKITELIYYSKNLINKFPKSERFDLCTDIKQSLYDILRKTILAWKERDNEERLKILIQIDVELYVIKSFTKIAYQYQYITPKNFMVWNEKIAEIGKMVGGWIKACQKE